MIKPHKIAHINPVIWGDMCNRLYKELLIELDCVAHPTPKEASRVHIQKIIAQILLFSPFSNTYRGPP